MPNDNPFSQLANIVKGQAQKHIGEALTGVPATLGTMTATGVKLDNFKHEIKDPMYLEPSVDMEVKGTWEVGAHNESGTITLPAIPTEPPANPTVAGDYGATFKFSSWSSGAIIKGTNIKLKFKPELKPGDRVLVIPVNDGQECVIICKVVG